MSWTWAAAPVDPRQALANRFSVTGVDISRGQLELARRAVPAARFIHGDMTRIDFADSSFDGIVALYSIIHVPRDRQRLLFESIHSWLRPGGVLVTSLASTEAEAWTEEDYYGAPMYWSSFDASTNKEMLRRAGFVLESAELITQRFDGEDETHLWVVAERPT